MQLRTASSATPLLSPLSLQARTKLVPSRLRSHSHGAGKVSSRSLTSNTIRRSGVAKPPKLPRWASPHACTRTFVVGVVARSTAQWYAHSALTRLLQRGHPVEAYCVMCDDYWPINAHERDSLTARLAGWYSRL